jgi:Fic family protein
MMSFRNEKLKKMSVPMNIVRIISKINEYKGRQDLYYQQSPEIIKTLKEVAIIQSTRASNSIEGIRINDRRLQDIMDEKVQPQNRPEEEIAGYRDVLFTIHSSYDSIPVTSSVIRQLHRDLYKFSPFHGGSLKNGDNIIQETSPSGEKRVRFRPVSAFETSNAMDELCSLFNDPEHQNEVDPLIMTCVFVFDFLCIHPFDDGNGRMARLLTLLLLYKSGYEVGRFISIEKIIEESKESYYETLEKSSQHWHEGQHNLFPWLEYMLGVIIAAYKEFESRVDIIDNSSGNKGERVIEAIAHFVSDFTKSDIRKACPDVGDSTINRALEKLKKEGRIERISAGRDAQWRNCNRP